ncbi:MAG: hypothetical protein JO327_09315, partial [Nitrososphaeraceae archaeon]|nr:hypothetical protein [Nitrososphaeraceae archaeon]
EELKGTVHELDFEYGICQFEYKTPPTPMDRLLDLNNLFEEFIEHLEVYGDIIVNISSAGTGPMYYFAKLLGVPSVCIGGTDLSNRSYSPNEYMRIDSLDKTIKCITIILEKFAITNTNVFKNKNVL